MPDTEIKVIATPGATSTEPPEVDLCIELHSMINPFPTITGDTFQFIKLPFDDSVEPTFWWGFGYNDGYLAQDWAEVELTGGIHSGVDFGIGYGTALYWTGTKEALYWGNQHPHFGLSPANIVLEVDGFYIIYGHISGLNPTLTPGESTIDAYDPSVASHTIIGYSGSDHLHLEIRPIDYRFHPYKADGFQATDDYEGNVIYPYSNGTYINPLTFFSNDLFYVWYEKFIVDYNDVNDLLLGYRDTTGIYPNSGEK